MGQRKKSEKKELFRQQAHLQHSFVLNKKNPGEVRLFAVCSFFFTKMGQFSFAEYRSTSILDTI